MAEYIDREKIRLEVCSDCTRHVSLVCQSPEPCYKLLAAFLEAKPVDVAPVVHGRWIRIYESGEPAIEQHQIGVCCSKCIEMPKDKFTESDFCPKCGAKMDGGEKANE